MKTNLDYKTFKNICITMAEDIKEYNPTEIVAIARGGFSAAHIIGKYLNLPVGVYIPKMNSMITNTSNAIGHRYVFVEDLVAQGRTFDMLCSYLQTISVGPPWDWKFAPVLIDGKYNASQNFYDKLITYGMKTEQWIVMPYEETDKMVEGDRGLFRNGDDQYGEYNG